MADLQKREITQETTALLRDPVGKRRSRKIGLEIEHVGFWPDCGPVHYSDSTLKDGTQRPGMGSLLRELSQRHEWPLKLGESGEALGLYSCPGNVTLEPGSQIELATAARDDLTSLVDQVAPFEKALSDISQDYGLSWVAVGVNPVSNPDDVELIPFPRYHFMDHYFQDTGQLGRSMMRLTSSLQINLDYLSEEEGIEMLRVALLAAPLSYALFSNSPLYRGTNTGRMSYRQFIWADTDPLRTGMMPEAFEPGFSFSEYADLACRRPLMYMQTREGKVVPGKGLSMADIARGADPLVELSEANARFALGQLFTEARFKPGFLEIRSVDGLRPSERYAAAAFWIGLLYDPDSRGFVLETFKALSAQDRAELLEQACTLGPRTPFEGRHLVDVASELLVRIKSFLTQRGFGEEAFLEPIERILEERRCPGDRLLEAVEDFCSPSTLSSMSSLGAPSTTTM